MEGDELLDRLCELKRKEAELEECVKALKWFCDRVDKGEVKSVKTYNRFEELLAKFEVKAASCCEGKPLARRYDPLMGNLHTKECIADEIDHLMNNSAPNSIHKPSGLTIKERIEQLQRAVVR